MTQFCHHCGEPCQEIVKEQDLVFCCDGCRQVYLILNQTDACDPALMKGLKGITPKGKFNTDKWNYLDEPAIAAKLVSFSDAKQVHISLRLPNIHCSSCIWLLEHLNTIHPGVLNSTVDFDRKEATVVYDPNQIQLSKLSATLDYIGYPPLISYADGQKSEEKKSNRQTILRIGVAGFCFSNIMMLSFPDYLSDAGVNEKLLSTTFNYISLILSIPVLLYGAAPFFIQAWKGLRQKFLNIDTPIAFAILVTFLRSLYEILTATGTGYLDSMSGIVFFMLIGRWFQEKTQRAVSFERDYKSYFPMSSTVINGEEKIHRPIEEIQKDDLLLIRNQELIPADAILRNGTAKIDYSFVTGEKDPVPVKLGQIVYAGGKQIGSAIELQVVRTISASHLTRLWNNEAFHNAKNKETSFVHPWSQYFSVVLFTIALSSGIYWELHDPSHTWKAVTAVLIVACPCSLLLSATFTFGNLMRIFGKKDLYLKNANVIEKIAEADTLVFDKTGTLTAGNSAAIQFEGSPLSPREMTLVKTATSQSGHPLSKRIASWESWPESLQEAKVNAYEEISGKGIIAQVLGHEVRIGNHEIVNAKAGDNHKDPTEGATVNLSIDGQYRGRFILRQDYRDGIFDMFATVASPKAEIHVLSGDNNREEEFLRKSIGRSSTLVFNKKPEEKLDYIRQLQEKGNKVMMIGDGLNDAGALQQSDVGIAVTDRSNYFTPACDAILEGNSLKQLDKLILLAKSGKKIVAASFALSIAYNIVGMYYSTQALLSPLIAAILMPASTISIILLTTLLGNLASRKLDMTKIMS